MIVKSALTAPSSSSPATDPSSTSTNNGPIEAEATLANKSCKQNDLNHEQKRSYVVEGSPTKVYPETHNPKSPSEFSCPESKPETHKTTNTNRCFFKCPKVFSRISNKIVRLVESHFYRLGYTTGKYPYLFISIGLLLTCITAGVHLKVKAKTDKEWIPKSLMHLNEISYWVKTWEYKQDSAVQEFPVDQTDIIVKDENILTAKSINQLMDIHDAVWTMEANTMKLPIYLKWDFLKMSSLLQIWNFNETLIRSLTTEDILRDVNKYQKRYKNVEHDIIAKFKKNDDGFITEAEVTRMTWKFAYTADAWDWEKKFSEYFHYNYTTPFKEFYFYTYYDYTDYGVGIDQDITNAIAGYCIMTCYVLISLGHCNCMEQKIGLTIAGMMCIAMGYGFTIGMGALLGVKTGKLNDILALMLLGIGIDDMFVILGTLRNFSPDIRSLSVPEQMGHVMKHAGVSITITTLSDVVAFGIGAFSVFPGLNTFCIYNAIGILAIYFYQITFFAACISLDLRRIFANRNACLCCLKYDEYKPHNCSKSDILQLVFEKFASCILSKNIAKAFVILFTVGIGAMNVWNTLQLKTDDDWQRIMFPTTHVYYKYYTASENYFPSVLLGVYCRDLDIQKNEVKLYNLSESILQSPYIYNSSVENWFTTFLKSPEWQNVNKTKDIYNDETLETFLNSKSGKPYQIYVQRDKTKVCTSLVPYVSFCLKTPKCSERSPLPKFLNSSLMQQCNKKHPDYEGFYSLCHCKVFFSMICSCKAPKCAPSNVTSFNVSCYKETSKICNFEQLDGKILLSYKMQCHMNIIMVKAFKIAVKQLKNYDNSYKLKTIEDLQSRVSHYFLNEECFAHANKYLKWRINQIIEKELIRNITLAFASVLVITLILITNIRTSLMVGSSVLLTMVNITGTLYMWGINIETTSCVILTISVGLVVDYSVHIGHTFMTVAGGKNQRMIVTLKEIGPPVFHGGFSTFIAVLPLSLSITYPFQTFFKIFFLVVLFGLFHGLIYLPVLLSIFGPESYITASVRERTPTPPNSKKEENHKQGITNNGMVLEGEFDQTDPKPNIETNHQIVKNNKSAIKHISGGVALDDQKSSIQTVKWKHIPT